jgi:L-cysteine/cystine lyase
VVSPFLPDDEKLAAVRQALPALSAGIYLNTGSAGPLPRETARAMADLAEFELTVGRAAPDYDLQSLERMAEARAAVAAILTADVDTVALTHSTTEGLNVGAWGIDWRRGDRAVTTSAEHPGAMGPLLALRDRRGVDLHIVDIGDGGDVDGILAAFDAAIDGKARLVVVSHVAWTTGAILPVREIAEIAHRAGALVLVDGAQAAGAIAVDVSALAADAYALPAQKWLLGPEGMGALWVAPSAADRLRPTFAGWFGFDEAGTRLPYRPFADARRFEWGTYHRPSVLGFARSCGWLAMFVGLDYVYRRGATLARRTADALAAIRGVEVISPRDRLGPLVTFRITGWPAEPALDELGRRSFAIARTVPETDWLRLSVGFFNTEAELDRLATTVAVLAAHSPKTLPPRASLTILGEDD